MLVNNAETLAEKGTVEALTGPVERADAVTVKRHLEAVSEREAMIYKCISEVLVEIAQKKNPKRDYSGIRKLLSEK